MTVSSVFEDEEEHLCLQMVSSPDERMEPGSQLLVEMPLLIGREESGRGVPLSRGRLGLEDGRISRKHARVSPGVQGQVVVADLGSKNGTWLNGRRVGEATVRRNDVLRFGDTLFVFCAMAPPGAGSEKDMGLVGCSKAMAEVRRAIRQVAGEALSVLVTGETGTGKELVAFAIHTRSGCSGAFVAVNSTAIPATLFESELFGVRRGAFSGATEYRKGFIREADRGTLFLDEIGDMPAEVQTKLLRSLEQQEVTPVGSGRSVPVDVRFLAATNAEIRERARDGDFRADLLHRLEQFPIVVPPLRSRREDIIQLWMHFALECGFGERSQEDANLLEALLVYEWPGNVRELRNIASQTSVRLKEPETTMLRALPTEMVRAYRDARKGRGVSNEQVQREPEVESFPYRYVSPRAARPNRETLVEALSRHDNSIAAVAREFGCHRQQIYRWMDHYGIERQ